MAPRDAGIPTSLREPDTAHRGDRIHRTPRADAAAGAGHEVHAVTTKERPPGGDRLSWHRADLLASADIVTEVAPEVLVHLAWYVEPGRYWTAPENIRWLEASLALLRAFAGAGGRRAVVAGTSAEYDWHAVGGRCHEQRTPLRPATLYGAAKHALHTAAAPYAEQAGFELAWGRIFFVYGPGEPRRAVSSRRWEGRCSPAGRYPRPAATRSATSCTSRTPPPPLPRSRTMTPRER